MSDSAEHTTTGVVVVGAGPVGLWLAAELRLAGVGVVVLEKRPERSPHSRALTLHARTLEVFALRGIVDRWLAEGIQVPSTHYAMLATRLDLSGLDCDYPFALSIPQKRTEELIEEHASSLGLDLRRGVEVLTVGHATDGAAHVRARDCSTGEEMTYDARYVVGCDGRRSTVRQSIGVGYTGTDDTLTCILGDVRVQDATMAKALSMSTERGSVYAVRINRDYSRVIGIEHETMHTARNKHATFDELRATIERVAGTDYGMFDPAWVTRVGSATFQADAYRRGRIFIAGDAAHVHFPMGGQGMNLGIQDAMNLGWKLAAVLRGDANDDLLTTYHAERAPVGAMVIEDTLSQTGLVAIPGREGVALRNTMDTALATNPRLNSDLGTFASGINVAYAADNSHPLAGHRVPNLPLTDGSTVFQMLHDGRPLLIGISPQDVSALIGAVSDRVHITPAMLAPPDGDWAGVHSAIIRPDGYLAWAPLPQGEQEGAESASKALLKLLPGLIAQL